MLLLHAHAGKGRAILDHRHRMYRAVIVRREPEGTTSALFGAKDDFVSEQGAIVSTIVDEPFITQQSHGTAIHGIGVKHG